jgi:hypothetical protein
MKKKRNRYHPFAFTLILMYRTLAATILLAIAACISTAAQNTTTASKDFRWLDPRKDAALFDQIKGAFVDELKRDDPKVKLVEPQLYKFHKKISRIGVFQSSALVLIAERDELASTYGHGDYFQAFNYDINTVKKEPFKKGFRDWRFHKFAHFSSAKTPDIVFTYLPVLEWEPDYSLSSFRFDQRRALWDMRAWSDNQDDEMIDIGSDTVEGSEEGEYETHCLFKVADFNGDGLDDVAVRCQFVGVEDRVIDTTLLYSIQQDKPVQATLTEPQRIAALTAKLCDETKKLRMCTSK